MARRLLAAIVSTKEYIIKKGVTMRRDVSNKIRASVLEYNRKTQSVKNGLVSLNRSEDTLRGYIAVIERYVAEVEPRAKIISEGRERTAIMAILRAAKLIPELLVEFSRNLELANRFNDHSINLDDAVLATSSALRLYHEINCHYAMALIKIGVARRQREKAEESRLDPLAVKLMHGLDVEIGPEEASKLLNIIRPDNVDLFLEIGQKFQLNPNQIGAIAVCFERYGYGIPVDGGLGLGLDYQLYGKLAHDLALIVGFVPSTENEVTILLVSAMQYLETEVLK
jgi:hypothetical protein